MDRPTTLPDATACPMCGGKFIVKARTVMRAWQPDASDELEWSCTKCGHEEIEARHKKDGEWPASQFQRERRSQ